jgi:hypothetical protein
MRDVMSAQVPLVLHLLVADLAHHLPPHRVHVQDVLQQATEYGQESLKFFF